jgi:hypothetical protein
MIKPTYYLRFNVINYIFMITTIRCVITQKIADIICFAAEVRNYDCCFLFNKLVNMLDIRNVLQRKTLQRNYK